MRYPIKVSETCFSFQAIIKSLIRFLVLFRWCFYIIRDYKCSVSRYCDFRKWPTLAGKLRRHHRFRQEIDGKPKQYSRPEDYGIIPATPGRTVWPGLLRLSHMNLRLLARLINHWFIFLNCYKQFYLLSLLFNCIVN